MVAFRGLEGRAMEEQVACHALRESFDAALCHARTAAVNA
jgi:hypothetical protein